MPDLQARIHAQRVEAEPEPMVLTNVLLPKVYGQEQESKRVKVLKIVAFLQNQWWHDPEGVKKRIANHADPETYRLRLISYGLSICTTGKRLEKYLLPTIGPEIWKTILWENSSREIGGKSKSSFPADVEHMQKVINEQDPDVILCFGAIAKEGLDRCALLSDTDVLHAVHPASRGNLDSLKHMALGINHLKVEWDG